MNVYLLPYTWTRHLAMALWCGGAGVVTWWVVLSAMLFIGLDWPPHWDGPLLLGTMAGAIAGASVLGEGNLRRVELKRRLALPVAAAAASAALAVLGDIVWRAVAAGIFARDFATDVADDSLVSLTFRFGSFGAAGLATAVGPLAVRRLHDPVSHLAGGVGGALAGAATWHLLGLTGLGQGMYLSAAALGLVWGGVFGLLSWGIPDALYAGWVRVLSGSRAGVRIPVDAPDGLPKERFIGHYPRGLDVFVPVHEGASELHVSVAVDGKQSYTARGLTLLPVQVRRFLEKVDLRYDPRRPAPLETGLSSGDRIVVGEGAQRAELEFLMLPREES